MIRKALAGLLVIFLALGTILISCGVENSDLSIKIPDELPTGQQLVKTGGEEILKENMGEYFPHYTGCKVYMYSINPSLSKYPPSIEGKTQVTVCSFNSEEETREDHQYLFTTADYAMPISEFINITKYREALEERPEYLQSALNLATDPDVFILGDMDCIVFPRGDKIVMVYGDYCLMVAETIYSLNAEADLTPSPTETETPSGEVPAEEEKGIPGFETIFAIAGLLAIAYMVLRRR